MGCEPCFTLGLSPIYNAKHMRLPGGPALAIDFKRLPCSTDVCMQVFPKMDIVAVLTVQLSGLFLSLTRVTL